MQDILRNFYYICWMELYCIKPKFERRGGGRLFINIHIYIYIYIYFLREGTFDRERRLFERRRLFEKKNGNRSWQ